MGWCKQNYRVIVSVYKLQINSYSRKNSGWKKLTAAKAVAFTVVNNEANAKSGNDWQKVESTWLIVVNGLKNIPQTSEAYQEAQNLLAEYQPKLIIAGIAPLKKN